MKKGIFIILCIVGIIVYACLIKLISLSEELSEHKQTPLYIETISTDAYEMRKICEAYGDLLHRMWIDNPKYVEDYVQSTVEYNNLDILFNGNWGDTYSFWSYYDSLEYYKNRMNTPDYMPKQADPDRIIPLQE